MKIKIGDVVMWRHSWGRAEPQRARVDCISLIVKSDDGEREDEENVKGVEIDSNGYCKLTGNDTSFFIISLDGIDPDTGEHTGKQYEKWCYGSQIDEVLESQP